MPPSRALRSSAFALGQQEAVRLAHSNACGTSHTCRIIGNLQVYPQEVSKNKELADKIEKYTIKSNKNSLIILKKHINLKEVLMYLFSLLSLISPIFTVKFRRKGTIKQKIYEICDALNCEHTSTETTA